MKQYPSNSKEVAIIGAGLVGCLAALNLAKLGYLVTIFEYRSDPRTIQDHQNLRSINLAISERGIAALQNIDLDLSKRILDQIVPMKGRLIHSAPNSSRSITYAQNYGVNGIECINSIDRNLLNIKLLNEIDTVPTIFAQFNRKLVNLIFPNEDQNDNANPILYFQSTTNQDSSSQNNILKRHDNFNFLIGADGSYSTTRSLLQKHIRMDFKQEYIDMAYLELFISSNPTHNTDSNSRFKLDKNYLHIWPRENFMLIALPNYDGSFTSTFFAPWHIMNSLNSNEEIISFFQTNFPDVLNSNLISQESLLNFFNSNPKSSLICTICNPYNYKGKCLLIGDAAHSMVPFYGQGMNCGFEDVRILSNLIIKNQFDIHDAFEEYTESRHRDLISILQLAKDNYKEMSSNVNSSIHLLSKRLDNGLSKILGDYWLPLYTMVSFRSDISYSQAIKINKRQYRILSTLQLSLLSFSVYFALKYSKPLLNFFNKK
ncbi:FAD-dependent oxidoreductase [Ascoidea rubescens DSM 1968]|uniref:Kynurenine 3-monooxygenase n=1 Tax=Ascoidea rubescens DSM 1968 TaxID=1344418 RepID=A0A1D2VDQ5_9ASCO|nr:FAD/NAD(P)-binding domain-containing protein [Ascoidea rubescens DSM 1968]ODV59623.1 FAD/NAD(P)-binding domain-containing protein [Ascoidea rubescens DSM 1968]